MEFCNFVPDRVSRHSDVGLIVVPASMTLSVLKAAHDDPLGGHQGPERTLARIKRQFYWLTVAHDVHQYRDSCSICQQVKAGRPQRVGQLQSMPPAAIWERIHLDTAGPFPVTPRGNRYLAVWIHAFDLPIWDSAVLLTDRAPSFIRLYMAEVTRILAIKQLFTSAFHPQTDGQAEIAVRAAKTMLQCFCRARPRDWDEMAPLMAAGYNMTPHSSTKESPFFLMFGRDPELVVPPLVRQRCLAYQPADYRRKLVETMDLARRLASEANKEAGEAQAEAYNHNRRLLPCFIPGERVWLWHLAEYRTGKEQEAWKPRWEGPYRIIRQTAPALYVLSGNKNRVTDPMHVNRLRPYVMRGVEPAPLADDSDSRKGFKDAEIGYISPIATMEDDDHVHEVELSEESIKLDSAVGAVAKLLAARKPGKWQIEYLVQFGAFENRPSSWAKEELCDRHCPKAVKHFWSLSPSTMDLLRHSAKPGTTIYSP